LTSSAPLLAVKGLTVAFRTGGRELVAVEHVGFDLASGEALGIVGESGSGKTATAMSLMRLLPEPPARILSGEIHFEGRDLLRLAERDLEHVRGRRIGMVFQEPMSSLNPLQSIGTQIAEPLVLHLGLDSAAARWRAIELLERVRIPAAADRLKAYPHELSGGLRQRVMIAIAIACDPALLIADEPTTALDVTTQAQVLALLRDLRQETGMAVILITHDLGVIADFVDRVAVMYAGRIVETAPVGAFFDAPQHPYTEALIRSLPDPGIDVERLVTIEGQVPRPFEWPPGCRFAPRCRYAKPECERAPPPLASLDAGRAVACIRPFGYRNPTP
jgi:peptide/nickel transport system ATP-binding protein